MEKAQSDQVRHAYRLDEFCQSFAVSRWAAYQEMKAGRLRTFKVRGLRMVAQEDATSWLESYRDAAPDRAA